MTNNIPILYEDDNLLAVNKPAGLLVHADGRTNEPTLSDWVVEHYPQTKDVGEPIKLSAGGEISKHGIVHRLDRETSGVILVAKNQETFLFFKRQFQDRTIKKVYRAIVHGTLKNERGTVDKPIGKSRGDFRRWTTGKDARGVLREAVTEYKVLCRAGGFSYLDIFPKTGRTHQIRVHMKAIGHPVVCDKLYTQKQTLARTDEEGGCALGLGRTALHALSIDVAARGGKRIKIEAPLPSDFQEALAELGCEI